MPIGGAAAASADAVASIFSSSSIPSSSSSSLNLAAFLSSIASNSFFEIFLLAGADAAVVPADAAAAGADAAVKPADAATAVMPSPTFLFFFHGGMVGWFVVDFVWCRQFMSQKTDVGALSVSDRHAMSARNRRHMHMSLTCRRHVGDIAG
jgi:hypothetical protein